MRDEDGLYAKLVTARKSFRSNGMTFDRDNRLNPRRHRIILCEVGLLTHHRFDSSTPSHSLTEQWPKEEAIDATRLRLPAAHSGRTVPEFHRSSLFTGSATTLPSPRTARVLSIAWLSSIVFSYKPSTPGGRWRLTLMAATASCQLLASPITPRQPFPLQLIFGSDRQAAAAIPEGESALWSGGCWKPEA